MGSSFYESLPFGWKTICTKGHTEEHNRKCFNWISPQGRKYRDWPEVQAYFQLQNFEFEIPGLECRPENARRSLTENVTLEENTKKESPDGISGSAGTGKTTGAAGKRKKRVNSVPAEAAAAGENKKEEEQPKPKKRGRKKKNDVDEDYVPEVESKKTSAKAKKSPVQKKSPPEPKQAAAVKEPTLDETPDVNEAKDPITEPEVMVGESVVSVEAMETAETEAAPPAVSSTREEAPSPSPSQGPVRTTSQVSTSNPSQVVASPAIKAKIIPQSKVKVETPKSAPTQVKQPAASHVSSQVRPQTPSQVRPQTPSQVRPQTPRQGPSQIRQQAPGQIISQVRPQTPSQTNTKVRPQTPGQTNSPLRAPTPRQVGPSQMRQQAPRPMTPGEARATATPPQALGGVRAPSQQSPAVRAQVQLPSPAVRAVRPVRAVRSSVSTPPPLRPSQRAATPVRAPGTKAGGAGAATPPSRLAGVRQQSPAVRPPTPSLTKPQTGGRDARYSEVPASLKSLVKFPSKVETNSGGGSSLYQAAGQHTSLGQSSWPALRRYCHGKMAEWWQWYQPYFTFPLQVKMKREGGQQTQKTIPSAGDFLKFLKTEESLHSFYISECELYCLANILGITINILTYSGQGKPGKWESFDPHQGLIHSNKFRGNNKEALYCLHEEKVRFNRLVKSK